MGLESLVAYLSTIQYEGCTYELVDGDPYQLKAIPITTPSNKGNYFTNNPIRLEELKNSLECNSSWVVFFKNESREVKDCVFLGANIYYLKKNHGNPEGVVIDSFNRMGDGADYSHILASMVNIKEDVLSCGIRVESDILENLHQTIIKGKLSADSHQQELPLKLQEFKGEKQKTDYIIDIKRKFKITGDDYFKFKLQPNSSITFTVYIQ